MKTFNCNTISTAPQMLLDFGFMPELGTAPQACVAEMQVMPVAVPDPVCWYHVPQGMQLGPVTPFKFDEDEELVDRHSETPSNWLLTDDQIKSMHMALLEEELMLLRSVDRKAEVWKEKRETLLWIFAPDVIDGKRVQEIPFSFHNCCLCSQTDPEDVRSALLQVEGVRSLLLDFKLCGEESLPPIRATTSYSQIVRHNKLSAKAARSVAEYR